MQVINAQSPVINLDNARHALVGGMVKTGEVLKMYADAMNQAFNLVNDAGKVTTPWYDLKGKLAAPVKEERAKFVAEMQAAGFDTGTIDVYWSRVKDASGRVKSNNKVKGALDVDALNIKDLKTILNRISDSESEKRPLSNKVIDLLVKAADLMGIETDGYGLTSDEEQGKENEE